MYVGTRIRRRTDRYSSVWTIDKTVIRDRQTHTCGSDACMIWPHMIGRRCTVEQDSTYNISEKVRLISYQIHFAFKNGPVGFETLQYMYSFSIAQYRCTTESIRKLATR